jgi:oligopeptide/dipeptide ABC transporter ATP-binding protein
MEKRTALAVSDLNVFFKTRHSRLHVVRNVNFNLAPGSRTAILGETGCGKSVMAMACFRLLPKNAKTTGSACLHGIGDILELPPSDMRRLRGDAMVLVPQNPMSYLNPVFDVGFHLKETIRRVNGLPKQLVGKKALSLLAQVGFSDPESVSTLFPHQLSGGMAQRVLLALGLTANPALVIADEPTRGLDVEARDRYLALSQKLYRKAAFLMITHDLSAAKSCDRIMVMYAGRVVEEGPAAKVLSQPRHPYTRGLVAAHPERGFRAIPGQPPRLNERFDGCAFMPRCAVAAPTCRTQAPPILDHGHHSVCCCHA